LLTLFVPVQEKVLAQRSGLSPHIIAQTLTELSKKQIIVYQPATENPLLTFVQNRVETRHLSFSQEVYNDRKSVAQKRLNAMIDYVTMSTKCRNKLLLDYFNENQSVRCGKCDICLRSNREELSEEEFEGLQKTIQFLLEKENLNIEQLVKRLRYPEAKIIQVVRWLIDNELINKEMNKLIMEK
jgi:ATP-dependent DNA helicase RecQ